MTNSFFDRFNHPSSMIEAEMELIALGEEAIPILETFFNGEACNEYGIPYRKFGLPVRCAMEVASRLGPVAKPLEHYLRAELAKGDHAAAMCLRGLGSLEEETVVELARSLSGDFEMSLESAYSLIDFGVADHPAVVATLAESERARNSFASIYRMRDREKGVTSDD